MISGFVKGFMAYFGAIGFIFEHRLFKHIFISGLISLFLGLAIFSGAYFLADDIGGFLIDYYPIEWGKRWVEKIASVISGGVLTVGGLLLFKYALLIIISPFMGPLSAKVEEIISGEEEITKFSIRQISYEMVRGLRIALRNVTKEIFYTICLFLLGLFPLFSIFTTIMIFLVQSYYVGFANFDYFLERRTTVKGSISYNRNHRGIVMGNGAAFILLLLIPIVGLFFAPVLGTIAATKTAMKQNDLPSYI